MSAPFWGKYRGIVTDVDDPMFSGRIRARVSDVTGDGDTGWAMPCVPFAGDQSGFFALPPVGSGVWIEFEHGDPEYPVWTGGWWGSAIEVPSDAILPPPASKKVLIATAGGHQILLDDTPGIGGITLTTSTGGKVAITATGIEISIGGASVKLDLATVNVNNGALQVV